RRRYAATAWTDCECGPRARVVIPLTRFRGSRYSPQPSRNLCARRLRSVCTGCNVCRPQATYAELCELGRRKVPVLISGASEIPAALIDSHQAVRVVVGMQVARLIQDRGLLDSEVQVRRTQVGFQLLNSPCAQ